MVLSDIEIREKIKSDNLIETAELKNVDPSSYELRMGNVYYDLTEDNKRVDLTYKQEVLIKPGHLVVLITKEKLNMPLDLTARVISKGSLFSIGLTPICTSADPGFCGQLGLVTQNISNKYISIPQGESLAKIEFLNLNSPAGASYKGQHGFHTDIWPIKERLQKEYCDIKNDKRVDSEEEEAHKIIPKSTSDLIKKVVKRQVRLNNLLILQILINVGLVAAIENKWMDSYISLTISILAGVITFYYTNKKSEASFGN
ncbi:hypothetical protein [Pseudoalteromonas sp. DY56-GL79]|uniref:dCTP deaminase n=1 Tax=Pseudoalteromonas sp. DY56-GL79 TaxID=2967131 RepID=UPI00352B67DD